MSHKDLRSLRSEFVEILELLYFWKLPRVLNGSVKATGEYLKKNMYLWVADM